MIAFMIALFVFLLISVCARYALPALIKSAPAALVNTLNGFCIFFAVVLGLVILLNLLNFLIKIFKK